MKRLKIILVITLLLLGGCHLGNMNNTPTRQTELFFNKYQTLDQAVMSNLNRVVDLETQFNDEQREKYKDLMKTHYQNLIYKIKEEEINGDQAIVTVEIEVTDYSNQLREADLYLIENPEDFQNEQGQYDVILYSDYRLDRLKKAEDKVKYTLDIGLTKVDQKWQVDQISQIDEEKIHGIYVY